MPFHTHTVRCWLQRGRTKKAMTICIFNCLFVRIVKFVMNAKKERWKKPAMPTNFIVTASRQASHLGTESPDMLTESHNRCSDPERRVMPIASGRVRSIQRDSVINLLASVGNNIIWWAASCAKYAIKVYCSAPTYSWDHKSFVGSVNVLQHICVLIWIGICR